MYVCVSHSCKAQRNLNSAFAIIMGLNTAAVSRLNQTWEVCVCVCVRVIVCVTEIIHSPYLSPLPLFQKVPGKFKKLFSELELITVRILCSTQLNTDPTHKS